MIGRHLSAILVVELFSKVEFRLYLLTIH
jgi:hypothetical protein